MKWQLLEEVFISNDFLNLVRKYTNLSDGYYLAQLLGQRNIKTEDQLRHFLDFKAYKPSSYLEFGEEILAAKNRLELALNQEENVAIWGDFDADGVTSTAVLWEGLGYYFKQDTNLFFYIPNRLKESHGLNELGINNLAKKNVKLIVTCDTGSTNFQEINYAQKLGIDVIVTDHHTLPEKRPPVTAIINPRYLPENHPLYHLSGVAVAYKLMECLAENWQNYRQFNPQELLDLVAIGLIADLVELKGDCRFLTKIGIEKLKETKRIGIKNLLNNCKAQGDRATDISYGIGPRINAISRIYGDANFCVELLTGKDEKKAKILASKAEDANIRRKSLQQDVIKDVKKKLQRIDLSTTNVIVLADNQWELGVLGLVAGKIAEEYGRPTILLSIIEENKVKIARGSARSTNRIDLYNLILSQRDLLLSFGGHPYAAGLSLLAENMEIFTNNINQKLRQKNIDFTPTIDIDLTVTVKDLCGDLLKEINFLEPFGMGNKVPKFLVKNCWFENVKTDKQYDNKNGNFLFSKISFNLRDNSTNDFFKGVFWPKNFQELPEKNRLDIIVERDFNSQTKKVQVRLIDFQETKDNIDYKKNNNFILDLRQNNNPKITPDMLLIEKCPTSWQELEKQAKIAQNNLQKLVLNYSYSPKYSPEEICFQLIEKSKYLATNNITINCHKLTEEFGIGFNTLQFGLIMLAKMGLISNIKDHEITFEKIKIDLNPLNFEKELLYFLHLLQEEQFKQEYFSQVSIEILQTKLLQ